MGQYWTRAFGDGQNANDQEDEDKNAFCPWTFANGTKVEVLLKEDREARPPRKRIEVVAAVIKDPSGRIFCAQRGYGDWKGWYEFPGGKIEEGETPEGALKREIREELATDIEVGELLTTVEYPYPTFDLTMHCYLCCFANETADGLRNGDAYETSNAYENDKQYLLLEHEDAKWLLPSELDSVKWLPADKAVIEMLKSK